MASETTGRGLKQHILALLSESDPRVCIDGIRRLPERRAVNPLFGFFMHPDECIRWRAISAMGDTVSRLADRNPESARTVIRRLMWQLNDESGGIGWGCPEAMGDITARNGPMAREYARILVSYLNPHGNFIEHPILQRGVLWGTGRLLQARPGEIRIQPAWLSPFAGSPDPHHRGLAAWCASALDTPSSLPLRQRLSHDTAAFRFYDGCRLIDATVSHMATGRIGFRA